MSTKLDRAIASLKDAAGNRPLVLVMEKAHRDASLSNVQIEYGNNQAQWAALGLLMLALELKKSQLRERQGS